MKRRTRTQFGRTPLGIAERGMSFDSIPAPKDTEGESEFARKVREREEGSLSPPPET